jgi:2,4-dienoyl-CoA reductase (NADPH2)
VGLGAFGEGRRIEGINLSEARRVQGGGERPGDLRRRLPDASTIAAAIEDGTRDGVSIGRPLIANPDLVNLFEPGHDRAPRPCTYCNKCLINFIENPLGCYEQSRFDSREEMIRQILSVYGARSRRARMSVIFEPLSSVR